MYFKKLSAVRRLTETDTSRLAKIRFPETLSVQSYAKRQSPKRQPAILLFSFIVFTDFGVPAPG
jgi:hypothetical protein